MNDFYKATLNKYGISLLDDCLMLNSKILNFVEIKSVEIIARKKPFQELALEYWRSFRSAGSWVIGSSNVSKGYINPFQDFLVVDLQEEPNIIFELSNYDKIGLTKALILLNKSIKSHLIDNKS